MKKIIYICIFVLVAVLATGFYIYHQPIPEKLVTVAATSTPPDLPRFIADNYGFAFSYSKDFEVVDMEDGHILIQPISQGRDLEQAIAL